MELSDDLGSEMDESEFNERDLLSLYFADTTMRSGATTRRPALWSRQPSGKEPTLRLRHHK